MHRSTMKQYNGLPFTFLFVLLGVLQASADNGLYITSNMNTLVSSGAAGVLVVTCDFLIDNFKASVEGADTKSLSSMTVYISTPQDQSARVLASIDATAPRVANTGEDFSGMATGEITEGAGGGALITLIMYNAGVEQEGEYICQPHVLNNLEEEVPVKPETIIITTEAHSVVNLQERINDLQQRLGKCEIGGDPSDTESPEQQDISQRQGETLAGISNRLAQSFVRRDSNVVASSDVFNSNTFYLILDSHLPHSNASEVCKRHRGYIAEVNTKEEFDFLSRLLMEKEDELLTHNGLELGGFVTGATFDGSNFVFNTHKDDPMYLGDVSAKLAFLEDTLNIVKEEDTVMFTGGPRQADECFICELGV